MGPVTPDIYLQKASCQHVHGENNTVLDHLSRECPKIEAKVWKMIDTLV